MATEATKPLKERRPGPYAQQTCPPVCDTCRFYAFNGDETEDVGIG